jgi:hypothetical protein
MERKGMLLGAVLGLVALGCAQTFFEDEIEAFHFHTYIFDVNPDHTAEALALRRKTREMIESGKLAECSLNQVNHNRTTTPVVTHDLSNWL